MKKNSLFLLFILLCSCNVQESDQGISLEAGFKNPPVESRPHVWWHWLDGHISKEGITNDIAAMAAQGIGGATILNVGISTGDFHDKKPTYDYMTAEWKALVTHAFSEAKKYGIRLSMHDCDGWSHTGGTWITPQQSMKTITFSKTVVKGGKTIKQQIPLPPGILNFYRDVTLLAYPATDAIKYSMYSKEYDIKSNTSCEHIDRVADGNIMSAAKFIPTENMLDDVRSKKYLTYWFKLFNPRQLIVVTSLCKEIRSIVENLSKEDKEYASAIGTYLSMILAKVNNA